MPARKKKKKAAGRKRCNAKTKADVRCARKSMPGTKRCWEHKQSDNNPTGRPRVVWSKEQWAAFDSMCVLTDKRHRIATAMRRDEKTVDRMVFEKHGRSFSDYLTERFEAGNLKLLSKQYESAMGGGKTMLVWLGKNRLGQRDKRDLTTGGAPILPAGAIIITQEQLASLPIDAIRAIRSVVAAEAFGNDS